MAVISTKDALALKIYAETLSAFERKNVLMELLTKQTIENGKSAQFIVNGVGDDADVATHALGALQTGTQMVMDERTIVVERPIYIRKELDQFEEKIQNANMRMMITGQNGGALAKKIDKRLFTELDVCFGTAGVGSQVGAGSVVNASISGGATAEAKGDAILDAIFAGLAIMNGKDITEEQVYFVTDNTNYYNLLQSQKAVNRDFNAGDNGSIADGNVFRIGDVMILRSNNLVKTGNTNATGTVQGWLFTKDCVGIVELMGMSTKEWFDDDYDFTVMKAQTTLGFGTLNPDALVCVRSATV